MNNREALISGILILLLYGVVQFFFYTPGSPTSSHFIPLEFAMLLPRILGLVFILVCLRRTWSWADAGLHTKGWQPVLLFGLPFFLLGFFNLGVHSYLDPAFSVLLYALVLSLVRALFEETLFRGLLFQSTSWLANEKVAILGSAALFTALQLGPHTIASLPAYFAFGILTAVLRAGGSSIWWLVILNFIIGSASFCGIGFIEQIAPTTADEEARAGFLYLVQVFAYLGIAGLAWYLLHLASKEKSPAES